MKVEESIIFSIMYDLGKLANTKGDHGHKSALKIQDMDTNVAILSMT